jgi:hypothetical protein
MALDASWVAAEASTARPNPPKKAAKKINALLLDNFMSFETHGIE